MLALNMVTLMFVERLDNTEHLTRLIPESRSCTLNSSDENRRTRIQKCFERSEEISIQDETFADLLDAAGQSGGEGGAIDGGWGVCCGMERSEFAEDRITNVADSDPDHYVQL
jgi:hypothetical protein